MAAALSLHHPPLMCMFKQQMGPKVAAIAKRRQAQRAAARAPIRMPTRRSAGLDARSFGLRSLLEGED